MIHNKLIEFSLFLSALLSGFYAGTGFFVARGGNPAITLMSERTFAEFWQHTDHFMAARMKIFGPLLLLTLLSAVLLLSKEYRSGSFWLILMAFAVLVADILFIFSTNHPLNHLVQGWDLNHLPSNVDDVKGKIVKAFNIRLVFMMGSFVLVLLALWFHKTRPAV